MEKIKKQSKKQISKKDSKDDLAASVPSAPTLEDFILEDVHEEDSLKQNDVQSCTDEISETAIEDDEKKSQSQVNLDKTSDIDCHSKKSISKNIVQSIADPIVETGTLKENAPTTKQLHKLYPDLTAIPKTTELLAYKHEKQEQQKLKTKIEEISIENFHENCNKNPLTKYVQDYVVKFLSEHNKLSEDDWFVCQIREYLKSTIDLKIMKDRVLEISNHCESLRKSIWSIEKCVAIQTGVCKDNIKVTVTHDYKKAILQQSVLKDLELNAKKLRDAGHKDYIITGHKSSLLKLKIQHFIIMVTNSAKTNEDILQIKWYISVLFYFIRKNPSELLFIQDIKTWLDILVKTFLKFEMADKELFLLSHILRCPPGISWAAKYIQCLKYQDKCDYFTSSHAELCLLLLHTMLKPIEERDEFLKSSMDVGVTTKVISTWILVDSDGEDDLASEIRPLKEIDVMALINQIPFEQFFSYILIYNKYKDMDIVYKQFLSFVRYSLNTVFILCGGLKTYSSSRYSTLSMLLGRLIKHTLDYVIEEFKIYLSKCSNKSINDEIDSFCIRIVQSVLWSNNCFKWQIISTLSWEYISVRALWCIFDHIFHKLEENDWSLNIKQVHEYELKYQIKDEQLFFDEISNLSENEQYFFLHALSNMIAHRSISDISFITLVIDVMLKIGFSTPNSSNSKWTRIYISSICDQHSQMPSYLIAKNNLLPSIALYLFKEIKLDKWQLQQNDLEMIRYWMLNFDSESFENKFGRYLLTNINYGYDSNTGNLFLDVALHFEIGLIIVKSCLNHEKNIAQKNKNYIAEGIKHVSNLVWSTTTDNYLKWCFETLRKLKVHCLSQSENICKLSCLPSREPLRNVIDVQSLEDIGQAVNDGHPVACYFALLATTCGHSVPIICNQGLKQIKMLSQCNEHESVVHILHLIVPLFLDCQEELLEDNTFTEILNGLVKVPFANKVFGGVAEIPHITTLFNNMIMHQVMSFSKYALPNPSCLITFWLKCIFKLDWNNNSVIFILNNLSQMVFIFPNSQNSAGDIIKSMLTNTLPESKSLFNWIYPTNNILTYSNLEAPWLEKLLIEMKHQLTERSNDLWKEIIEQINIYEGKLVIEKAIQNAAVVINVTISSKLLSVYRWADMGLKIPIKHPISPLIWQQFFFLLLERVKLSNDRYSCFGLNFLPDSTVSKKSLLEHFDKAQKYFLSCTMNLQNECAEGGVDQILKNKLEAYHNLTRLYGLFKCWLNEPRIFDANFDFYNLPANYEPALLYSIMTNNTNCMIPFLDTFSMHEEIMNAVKKFDDYFFVTNNKAPPHSSSQTFSTLLPEEKIKAKLSSYETPVKFEEIANTTDLVLNISEDILKNLAITKKYMQKYIEILLQYAKNYSNKVLEHTSLDYTLADLYPLLYQNVPFKKKVMANCNSVALYDRLMRRESTCTGSVEVTLEYTDLQIDASIQCKIQRNIDDIDTIISSILNGVHTDLCAATATIEEIIRLICSKKSAIGKDMFYFILDLRFKERSAFLPLSRLFDASLSKLAKTFYHNDDSAIYELCTKIESNLNLLPMICKVLPVENLTQASFVTMYSYICKYNLSINNKIELLEKFDIQKWINNSEKGHAYILELVYIIENTLFCFNISDIDENFFDIHKILIQHAISVYNYKHPLYYWNILQMIMKGLNNLKITKYFLERFISEYCCNIKFDFYKEDFKYDKSFWLDIKHNPSAQPILLETCSYLYKHFLSERLQTGVFGLYTKYQNYLMEIRILLATVTCCAGHCMKEVVGGSAKINVKFMINAIFSAWIPWLVPLHQPRLNQKLPDWIQQLVLDGPLLPCSSDNGPEINQMIMTFIDCALVVDKLIKDCDVVNYILNMYIEDFCNPKIPNYIIKHMNNGLLQIPWKDYKVQSVDIVNMHRITMQFLPECHYLIGQIFVQIQWQDFLQSLWKNNEQHTNMNILSFFIDLMIHIAYEPSLRNKSCMLTILDSVLLYDWSIIEGLTTETLCNWFVMTANPVGLISKSAEFATDKAILRIIESTIGDSSINVDFFKVYTIIRAKVKLLKIIVKRNLAPNAAEKLEFQAVIEKLLNLAQNVINKNENKEKGIELGSQMYKEILILINLEDSRYNYVDYVQTVVKEHISKDIQINCIKAMLRILSTVTNESTNAIIMETLLMVYFNTIKGSDNEFVNHWYILNKELGKTFIPSAKVLAKGSYIMSMHIYYQRLITDNSYEQLLKNVELMLMNLDHITPNLNNEHLLPLLWFDILKSFSFLSNSHEKFVVKHINHFCDYLEKHAISSSGILEMLNLKRNSITEKFKLLCRILQAILLSKLCFVDNELVLRINNRIPTSTESIPKLHCLKEELLSKKANVSEKLLLEKGIEYINSESNFDDSFFSIFKTILNLAYEFNFYIHL